MLWAVAGSLGFIYTSSPWQQHTCFPLVGRPGTGKTHGSHFVDEQ